MTEERENVVVREHPSLIKEERESVVSFARHCLIAEGKRL